MKSEELDWWRNYFRSSNSNIFDLIKNAITVAVSDFPKEFSLQRDRIAQKLYTCNLSRPCEEEGFKGGFDSKESRVDSTTMDEETVTNTNQILECCFGDEEAVTDQIEEGNMTTAEVLKIKGLFQNPELESDSVLLESLKRLKVINLTFEILQNTEIGKAVNRLRKHGLKDIRNLARSLIEDWKTMVDQWVTVKSEATTEGTPISTNPSVLDEEQGLPSPPIDDGIFFATPTSIEFSNFFDCMDEDGNIKNVESVVKPEVEKRPVLKMKPQIHNQRENEGVVKPKKPLVTEYAPRRLQRSGTDDSKFPQQERVVNAVPKKPLLQGRPQNQVKKFSNDDEMRKLETTKRKLHERYQEADLAKKQRTIQVVEMKDIPKQGAGRKNPPIKLVNRNRPVMRR